MQIAQEADLGRENGGVGAYSFQQCGRPITNSGQPVSGASWFPNSPPKSATTTNLRLPRVQRPWPDATCVLNADPSSALLIDRREAHGDVRAGSWRLAGRIHLGPDAQLHQRKPRADLSTKPATLLPKIRAAGTGQPDFQNESLTLLIAGWLRFFTLIQYRGFARYESCGTTS
jgi:hypothetical protein